MKYKLILLFLILTSCAQNFTKSELAKPFNAKGFAYIYNEVDYEKKIIKKRLDKNTYQIAHNSLKPGALIKIINLRTKDSIILKNSKKIEYPNFYKILITEPVSSKLKLHNEYPLVEIIEVKKNKSFVAKKTKIFKEEEKIHNNAPVETVKIDNISVNQKKNSKKNKYSFNIIIAEFYSEKSAFLLKKRITKELPTFPAKKLFIKTKKTNKITLLSGPYNSINLMKNDYIQLNKFGFEELDVDINE